MDENAHHYSSSLTTFKFRIKEHIQELLELSEQRP